MSVHPYYEFGEAGKVKSSTSQQIFVNNKCCSLVWLIVYLKYTEESHLSRDRPILGEFVAKLVLSLTRLFR